MIRRDHPGEIVPTTMSIRAPPARGGVTGRDGRPPPPEDSTVTTTLALSRDTACDRETSTTRSLLGYGALAGPVYVGVSLAQALTRDGFDLARHPWSLLATGPAGWVQVTNLVLTGAMVVAFATGLRRALTGGPGARWAPRLVTVYGLSLIAAGVFRADPAQGFPAGTPEGPGAVTWQGTLHLVAGGVGFTCLAAACFVVAHRYAREDRRPAAMASRVVGAAFLAGFAGMAAGAGNPVGNLAFTAAVVLVWAWLAAVAVDRYRTARS
jgi:Protein of unknown function (DUF998)